MKLETATVKLDLSDLDWASALLAGAFLNEPPVTVIFDEARRRREQAAYFMRSSCAYALRFGEAYTTPEREGAALWLVPGKTDMTLGRMYRAGMLSAPFRLGWSAFRRFAGFAEQTDRMHRRAAPAPHYYLFVLGVAPSAQGKGVGGVLLKDMLARIDREKMPAFLETQKKENVALYEKFGFEVAAHDSFPKLEGLSNWAMFRKAAD